MLRYEQFGHLSETTCPRGYLGPSDNHVCEVYPRFQTMLRYALPVSGILLAVRGRKTSRFAGNFRPRQCGTLWNSLPHHTTRFWQPSYSLPSGCTGARSYLLPEGWRAQCETVIPCFPRLLNFFFLYTSISKFREDCRLWLSSRIPREGA